MAIWKRKKIARQDWQPNGLVQVLRAIWTVLLSVLKVAVGALVTVFCIGVVCAFVFVGAVGDYLQEDVIPNISFDSEDFSLDQTSFIYYVDANGDIQEYEKINTSTDRQWATIDEIPQELINAAIAIEDQRFYEHQGVDWLTTVKACAGMFFGGNGAGGSTITQQLIKNITGENSVTVQRKVEEIFRAIAFERENDKDTIMEWYLNTIYFGNNKYGVKSAAMYYFGKNLNELTIADCASLISITNNPSLYNPYRRPVNNRDRQENVLWAMHQQGLITDEEYQEAWDQEMVFKQGSEDEITYTCAECGFTGERDDFTATEEEELYLCPECQTEIKIEKINEVYSWYTEMVLDDVAYDLCIANGDEWNSTTKKTYLELIKLGGYHIYSCIDVDVQAIVDEVYTNLENVPTTRSSQQLISSIVIVDNRTGDVVAVAGNVGEKTVWDATNHATEDDPKQTGSSTKPLLVYAPAFELGGFSPATVLDDLPLNYSSGTEFPKNVDRVYRISTSIFTGIEDSMNTIAVGTLDKIGLQYAFEFGKYKFRLEGLLEEELKDDGTVRSDIGYSPLALGALSYGVSVEDMAAAYATFPNDGEYREARTYTKVYDSDGNLILDNTQETEQILGEKAINYIHYTLRNVVSHSSVTNLSSTAAYGKTGTTSSSRDRWFCGYTSYYTAAVWCGYKQPEEIKLTGSSVNPASRMWAQVMKKLHQDVEWRNEGTTSGMRSITICLDCGGLAIDACAADPREERTQSVKVYPEDIPEKSCSCHILVDWCTVGDGAATEFCQMAGATIVPRGLVKYTQDKIKEIKRASKVPSFSDDFICLVDAAGNPVNSFKGIAGDINANIDAPYRVCTVHTAETVIPPTEPETSEPGEGTGDEGGEGGIGDIIDDLLGGG